MERIVKCFLVYNFKSGKFRLTKLKPKKLNPVEIDIILTFKIVSEDYITPTINKEINIPAAKIAEITSELV